MHSAGFSDGWRWLKGRRTISVKLASRLRNFGIIYWALPPKTLEFWYVSKRSNDLMSCQAKFQLKIWCLNPKITPQESSTVREKNNNYHNLTIIYIIIFGDSCIFFTIICIFYFAIIISQISKHFSFSISRSIAIQINSDWNKEVTINFWKCKRY